MSRILVGGLVLALAVAFAVTEAAAVSARSLPMQFEWQQEGPAEVCGTQCRTWVSAVGTITSQSPHEFSEFARQHDLRGAMLVLDSGGGSVHGAIALGRQIRRLGMSTSVGKTIALRGRASAKPLARLSARADCESMCVFVLLAGAERIIPQGARVMVHQIWLGDRRDDAAAAAYSAEDLVLVQRDIGRLAQYTVEMGGSIDFLELSLRIPPWEPMRALTRDEIRRMHVATGPQPAPSSAASVATAASSPSVLTGSTSLPTEGKARGWIAAERSGYPTLVRSHQLTVEGKVIGSFDLAVACGARPGLLDIEYRERRVVSAGSADMLKSVVLSLGVQSEPLQVVSSGLAPRSLELNTQARGTVPVSFVRSFSELSSRALVISTASANELRTAIRVGNSGIGPGFAKLQQVCGSGHQHATNARTATGDRH